MLEEKLLSILGVLEKSVVAVAGVASKELPILAQELLTFKTIWHWIIVVLFGLLFMLVLTLYVAASRDRSDTEGMPTTMFVILLPLLFSGYYLVMIHVAPRLYLLGQIKEILRH